MKKNVLYLGAIASVALLAASCSDDDSNNNNTTPGNTVELYTSSNTSGRITVTDVSAINLETKTLLVGDNLDCDGIFYDAGTDMIIQASRTKTRLNAYTGVQGLLANGTPSLTLDGNSSEMDFTNPREISVSGDNIFVVQDAAESNGNTNKIYVYQRSGLTFTRTKVYTTDFNLWGIHAEGNDLYAVVDNSGDIAKFENILSNAEGTIFPTKKVTIAGLVRTHGITYSAEDNLMVLTDIGDANIDDDGAIIVIDNWSNVFANTASGGTMPLTMQNKIYGTSTRLGNPVDVAYDHVNNKVFVAERLNGGGRVLTFDKPVVAVDHSAPIDNRLVEGVSAVYLSRR